MQLFESFRGDLMKHKTKQYKVLIKKQAHLFMNWEKLRRSARATFEKTKIFLWNGNNLRVKPQTNTQKTQFMNLWMNWEKLHPNLSFTV